MQIKHLRNALISSFRRIITHNFISYFLVLRWEYQINYENWMITSTDSNESNLVFFPSMLFYVNAIFK